jgi:pSer/pThr/pTyr-binding forkhead associated (FHA) protein
MHDGRTRRVARGEEAGLRRDWLARHRASLVLVSGPAAGSEYELTQSRVLIGRSPAATIRLDDLSISAEHAALELDSEGFGIRDLASTNGVRVNGAEALSCALKNGDRVEVGAVELRYIVLPGRNGAAWRVEGDD